MAVIAAVAEFERNLLIERTQSGLARAKAEGKALGRPLGFKSFVRAAVVIAGVELLHRIRKGQFNLGRLRLKGQAVPAIWNTVLSV